MRLRRRNESLYDHAVFTLYLRDNLTHVGFETFIPHLVRGRLFLLSHFPSRVPAVCLKLSTGSDLLGDFSQVVAFRGKLERFPEACLDDA